jgi:mannose-1-phosphate guanylyltransferase
MAGALPWPAVILTAGYGTRFRPLSYVRAKPAVPVAGIPLVRRILAYLARAGVSEAVLNLHYRPETITAVVGDASDLGLAVRYSWEPTLLGSAGGPARALTLLDAPRFFIVNGDTLVDVDLAALAAAHEARRPRVSLALGPNPNPGRYGGVVVDPAGSVLRFVAPGAPESPGSLHFVGVQLVEADVFADVPLDRPTETVRELYPALIRARRDAVASFSTGACFRDIGTPADYLATSLDVAREEGLHTLPLGRDCRVSPGARLERTAVWDGVTVGDACDVTGSILADGVAVPDGTHVSGCAVVRAAGRAAVSGETRLGDLILHPLSGTPGRPKTDTPPSFAGPR